MDIQIDSSAKIESDQKPKAAPHESWSSMNLLSCDLTLLMREMLLVSQVDQSLQTEDNTYISNALTHCKLAKQFKLMGQYELNIFHFRKAAKIID